ncbi:MAG: transporter, partial [Burkholderiaceae bacterium]
MKSPAWLRMVAAMVLATGALGPAEVLAQVPGRFYWKTLSGANAVPVIYNSISGNTNPFDMGHTVTPGANFDATLMMTGYAHTFTLWDRSAMAAVILPMGRISGDVTVAGNTATQSASGFGDPMLEFNLNLIGPKAQKNIPDVVRYEPGFSLDVLADLALPIGEYNSD